MIMQHTAPMTSVGIVPVEPLAPEIVSFCTLLARIMHRCLQERDPRIVSLLSVSALPQEVSHEQAA